MLSESEFLSIKEKFVAQVIEKLRGFARQEAELLTRVHAHRPQIPLPEISVRLSKAMIRISDAIEAELDRMESQEPDLMHQLVKDHLPAVLIDTAGERLWNRTPRPYLKWIMAKSLAGRIVYREGFEYLESMPMGAIAELALRYLRLEIERLRLIAAVRSSNLPDRERLAEVLSEAGIVSTLE